MKKRVELMVKGLFDSQVSSIKAHQTISQVQQGDGRLEDEDGEGRSSGADN